MTAPTLRSPERAVEARATPRRADIDGLRTLAIALVVVYHVWFGRVSGGVDVFLLISAYFLTASFLRRMERTDRLRLGSFWARRFARLLPAAGVTILGTIAFAALALPLSMWPGVWDGAWASLLYVENWQLAAESVDYYARDETLPSMFQHFWSLSIQGQVFVLWPLVFAVLALVVRRTRLAPRWTAAAVFGVIFAGSLAYSVVTTAADQAFAYFDTGARLWEFALGSLVAVFASSVRVGRVAAGILGVVGLAGLVSCGFVFDVGAGFPGWIALWPTLSAVALILAGQAERPGFVSRMLASTPLSAMGRVAYSLYLVHWPILIGFLVLTERSSAGLYGGATVIALSVVAATVLYLLVERPLQRARSLRSHLAVLGATMLAVSVPLAAWQSFEQVRAQMVITTANPGALALMPELDVEMPEDAARMPVGSALDKEWVVLDGPCTGVIAPESAAVAETCFHNGGGEAAAPTVLVLGDSHAEQWMGAVIPLADANGWNLISVLKGGCPVAAGEPRADHEDCAQWRQDAVDYTERLRPDVVMLMGTKTVPEESSERLPRGLEDVVDRFVAAGSEVVLVRDNPRFESDMFHCVEVSGPDAAECTRERDAVLAAANPSQRLAAAQVHVIDLTDYLCPDGTCPPVIGNIVVYLDHDHITGAYARTLAMPLRASLEDVAALGEILPPTMTGDG